MEVVVSHSVLLTDGGQKSGNGSSVLVANNLVLAENVSADTLNNTDLALPLVVELPEGEWEGTELLDDLVEGLLGAVSLETVGEGGAAVQSSSVLKVLELTGSQGDTDLNTPYLTDLRDTLTLGALSWCQDDLLLSLNLVALEQPRGGALDEVAVVALDDLLEKAGHAALGNWLLGSGLGLLLGGTGRQESRWDHQAQEKLVRVVGSQDQVRGAGLILAAGDDDVVANDCSETVDLGTELDLDHITGVQDNLGLGLVGLERGIWGDERRRGDGGRVGDT